MAILFNDADCALAREVISGATRSGLRISCAESCTGGLISALLTEIPGSSAVIDLSWVTYANQAKTAMLGVDKELLHEYGAVSEQVALAMAEGARRVSGADIAVAATGIAGPGGGSTEKPVGTVFLAVMSERETTVNRFVFQGSRTEIRLQATRQALLMLQSALTHSFSSFA